jgi:uncharacterized protein YbjQ (UPF0145 family)
MLTGLLIGIAAGWIICAAMATRAKRQELRTIAQERLYALERSGRAEAARARVRERTREIAMRRLREMAERDTTPAA